MENVGNVQRSRRLSKFTAGLQPLRRPGLHLDYFARDKVREKGVACLCGTSACRLDGRSDVLCRSVCIGHVPQSPESPAGTGLQASEAMGKFIKGIASSGAWCFDEFNRTNLEARCCFACTATMNKTGFHGMSCFLSDCLRPGAVSGVTAGGTPASPLFFSGKDRCWKGSDLGRTC